MPRGYPLQPKLQSTLLKEEAAALDDDRDRAVFVLQFMTHPCF